MKKRRKRYVSGSLRKISKRNILAFKINNRRGFAVMANGCLTEGRTLAQAYTRLVKACRRFGFQLPDNTLPPLRKF